MVFCNLHYIEYYNIPCYLYNLFVRSAVYAVYCHVCSINFGYTTAAKLNHYIYITVYLQFGAVLAVLVVDMLVDENGNMLERQQSVWPHLQGKVPFP